MATGEEIETRPREWLESLGITEPCGLDRLSTIQLRDLARQIRRAVDRAGQKAFVVALLVAVVGMILFLAFVGALCIAIGGPGLPSP